MQETYTVGLSNYSLISGNESLDQSSSISKLRSWPKSTGDSVRFLLCTLFPFLLALFADRVGHFRSQAARIQESVLLTETDISLNETRLSEFETQIETLNARARRAHSCLCFEGCQSQSRYYEELFDQRNLFCIMFHYSTLSS